MGSDFNLRPGHGSQTGAGKAAPAMQDIHLTEWAADCHQTESGNNRPISAIIDCYCLRDGKESTMIEQPSKYFLPGLTLGRPLWAACFY
jgi:hypothetical protein